ncbi:MAG: HEAT repeat domain-containing protein [Chloroflexi bacterium]|nr:HEAT repeat domain-containing protein [Chloroflexota bacterium]
MPESAILAPVLDSLRAGDQLPPGRLGALSSLTRSEADAVRAAWPAIPVASREALLVAAAGLSHEQVDLDFTELASVALDDPVPSVRLLGIDALWEATDRRTATKLTALVLRDREDDVRAAAAAALGQFVLLREYEEFNAAQGDEIVDALRAVAEDATAPAELRARAVESLGARSLPWVEELISDAYYDDNRALRLAAVVAMGATASENWLEFLYDQLQSEDPAFRCEAALACGTIASEDATEYLVPLLDDDDPDVVVATIMALGEVSGPDALRALREFAIRAAPEFEDDVATAIEEATFAMEGRRSDDDDAWDDEDE